MSQRLASLFTFSNSAFLKFSSSISLNGFVHTLTYCCDRILDISLLYVTFVIRFPPCMEIEPQRCSMTTGTPRTKRW